MKERFTRRELLRFAGLGSAVALLASCAPKVVEVEKIVEKEVTKEVEKIVKEVVKETVIVAGTPKVVEREVTKIVKEVVKETIVVEPAQKYKCVLVFAPRSAPPKEDFIPWFSERHPEIDARYEMGAHPTIRERLTAHMVAGDCPDIFGTCCSDSTFFIQQGQTLNCQPFIDRDNWDTSDFHPLQFRPWKLEGDIYCLPTYTGIMALTYNKDMFDEKGVEYPPTEWGELTFDEYHELCNKFVKRDEPLEWGSTHYGFGANWLSQYWLRGFGAFMVDPDDWDVCGLCSPEALECIEMMRKMVHDEHSFAYGGEMGGVGAPAMFNAGRTAMLEIGSWNLNNTRQGADFAWDVAPLWGGKGGPTSHVSVDGNSIWAETAYPEEAWILLSELTSPESEMMMGGQPSRVSLTDWWVNNMRAEYPAFEDVNMEVYTQVGPLGIGEPEEMFTNDNECKRTILGPAFEQVVLLDKAPAELICEYCKVATRYNKGEIPLEDLGGILDKIKV